MHVVEGVDVDDHVLVDAIDVKIAGEVAMLQILSRFQVDTAHALIGVAHQIGVRCVMTHNVRHVIIEPSLAQHLSPLHVVI